MKKFEKKSSLKNISYNFYKKCGLVALLLALSLPLSQKASSITIQKKSETKELFDELVNCSLGEIDIIEYIVNQNLITTSTIDQLTSEEDRLVIDSLGIGQGITAVGLYNKQFRDNWIAFKQEFIAVLDTLGVPRELVPRFHRTLSDKIYHNTPNTVIPTLLPKDYNRIISMIGATKNALACDFFKQGGISLPKQKKITKRRFTPKVKKDTTNTLQILKKNNIHLWSSQLHHKENGLSYEHGRTCIVGMKGHVTGFLKTLSQQLGEVWVTGGTERGHMGERYCVAGLAEGRSLQSAKKLHGAGNVIDIALHGVSSLWLFEYFPHQKGRFSFLGYTGTYSYHAHGGEKNTTNSFKQQQEKISPSMHLHLFIESGPTLSLHSSPSDTITTHQQHHAVLEAPSI